MRKTFTVNSVYSDNVALSIRNCSFAHKGTSTKFALKDVNIEIQCGQIIAVVGHVGSGKTSLLLSILGEMQKLHGSIFVNVIKNFFILHFVLLNVLLLE